MLRRYLASEAYMYCGATLYNIPWMLLYFSGKYISLWHVRVRKESWLHFRLDFVEHEQKYSSKEDTVKETIAVRLSTRDRNDRQVGPDGKVFQKDKTKIIKRLDINEYRYPNLTASEKKVVKPGLQELAYKLMPEI